MKRKAPPSAFKPGQSGNPGGRKKLPEDIKAARAMATEDMLRTVIEVRSMSPVDLKKIDMNIVPFGKRAIMNAYVKMDYRGIKDYEDRLFGKAQEYVELTGNNGEPLKVMFDIQYVKSESADSRST